MNWEQVHHFRPEEWRDDPSKVSPELVLILDHFRSMINAPVIIHCAWQQDGHSLKSYHYTGQAVDFHVEGAPLELQYSVLASIRDIGGLGFYPGWNLPGWHVDLRSGKDRLEWRRKDGLYAYGPTVIWNAIKGVI